MTITTIFCFVFLFFLTLAAAFRTSATIPICGRNHRLSRASRMSFLKTLSRRFQGHGAQVLQIREVSIDDTEALRAIWLTDIEVNTTKEILNAPGVVAVELKRLLYWLNEMRQVLNARPHVCTLCSEKTSARKVCKPKPLHDRFFRNLQMEVLHTVKKILNIKTKEGQCLRSEINSNFVNISRPPARSLSAHPCSVYSNQITHHLKSLTNF